jgi:hypothetical protein
LDYGDYLHWVGWVGTPGFACDVAVGGIYAFGSAPTQNTIQLIPDDDPDDETVPLPRELELRFRRLTFILGFSIGF